MCLRVIKPRIISYHGKGSFLTPFSSFFFDPFSCCWVSFFAISRHLSFCFPLHIPTFSRMSSSFFFFLFAFRTQFIPHLSSYDILSLFLKCDLISHNLRSDPSWYLPPSVEGDPWSGIRRKIIKLKRGSNRIIFYE